MNLLNDLAAQFSEKEHGRAISYLDRSETISETIGYTKGRAMSILLRGKTLASQSNNEIGLKHFEKALDLYRSINFKEGIAACHASIGRFYHKNGNQKKAIDHYNKTLDIYKVLNDKVKIFGVLNDIGWSQIQAGNYDEAIVSYNRSLSYKDSDGNKKNLAYCYKNLGIALTLKSNYALALDYFKKSIAIGEELNDSIIMGDIYGNMGPVYNHIQRYDDAEESYRRSIEYLNGKFKDGLASNLSNLGLTYRDKKDYERAKYYLERAKVLYKEIRNKIGEAYTNNNLGEVHLLLHKNDKAFQYYERGKDLSLEVNSNLGLTVAYLGLSECYLRQKNYGKALDCALKSQRISNGIGSVDYQRDAAKLLSTIYKNMNLYQKAFVSHEKFKTLSDSLFNREKIEKITALEYKYKYERIFDSINIRESQLNNTIKTTFEHLERSEHKYLLATIAILLMAILSGSVIFYQKYRNIRIKNQNIAIEQKLLRSQMGPHFIFNSLSVLQGMILNNENEKSVSYLSKLSRLIRITLENSRDKTVSLSEELKAVEYYLALNNLENESYQYSIVIDNIIDTTAFEIPPMLIQPFVENAIEHAFLNDESGDKQIDIALTYSDQGLSCTIVDNGIGLKSKSGSKGTDKTSLSTTITEERLKIISRDFKMEGSVIVEDREKYNQRGTKVTLVIPYKTVPAS